MDGNAYKIKATKPSGGAVIFLHGLGDSGEGWSMVSHLSILIGQRIRTF